MNNESLQTAGDETANAGVVAESNAEAEQLRSENAELKSMLRMRDAREALFTELNAAGARSPELLFASVQDDIQFDADGMPSNIAAIAAALRDRFPEQFVSDRPASIDAGAGHAGQNGYLTRDALAKMKPEEIARLDWDDVRQALAN